MNIHKAIDNFILDLSSLPSIRSKLFCESVESPSYAEHLRAMTLELPNIEREGFYELTAKTLVGELKVGFHVAQWKGEGFPAIIYHHGNNERPFNYGFFSINTFKWILFSRKDEIAANMISLRAAFHQNLREYLGRLRKLSHFVAMMAVSVMLIEKLVSYLREKKIGCILVAGMSLGGFVTNLHRTYFSSADVYVPLLAGTQLGDLFLESAFKKILSPLARKNFSTIRKILNFEADFMKVEDDNVFPLLAGYDQIVNYKEQKKCYGSRPIAVIEKGHISAVLERAKLRQHFLLQLE